MLWLAIHFPRLPLEIFSIASSEPAVVLENNRVLLRNQAAQASGITPGTTLATAHSITPGLKHKHRAPVAELKKLTTLADTLYRFSSYVSLQPPDCILLEIGASLKLFGSSIQLGEQVVALCHELGHQVVVREAQTPWAAIALARSRQQALAQVSLADAGLELAGIKADVVERFANMGIYTLGPLLKMSAKSLGRRFGKPLLTYLAQLTGDLPDPRVATSPAATFSQALHLLDPIRDKDTLHQYAFSPMSKLTQALQHWLITHQLGCEALVWVFSSHQQECIEVPLRFTNGKQNSQELLKVSQLKLDQAQLPREVLTVALTAKRVQPWLGASQSLFKTLSPVTSNNSHLGAMVDELVARLGDQSVRGIQSQPQHRPEAAWTTVPAHQLLKTRPKAASARLTNNTPAQSGRRPLWLFDPPRCVSPAQLQILHGPERIVSHWWQGEAVCRDYYIARHQQGAQCWVYEDVSAQWYLHGYFG
ncbi:MAG: DNA polymerase Y family protein [Pseudomonadaceae bacterium]|nr:DNA polymerase Y family protein [Pseudomonadaceae bacterium]